VRFLAAVELLQIAAIGLLAVGYRRLQRRLDEDFRFARHPPRSITEDVYGRPGSTFTESLREEAKSGPARRP
jgi:hypothetical protein